MQNVAEIANLVRRYRRTTALDGVTITIPRGGVVGLVGENGAGKTTLIKHVLGLLRAQTGTVRVFGLDPVKHPQEVLGRVGYLSENRDLPGWMRIEELLRYTRALYPKWDPEYAKKLVGMFELDPGAKVRTLSMGQTAKAALVTALAHRPEFLVLDEPSSGLDPLVRRDILEAVLRETANEGRTALFSSHLLHEVENISDRVVMISAGKVILDRPLRDMMGSYHKLVLEGPNGLAPSGRVAGMLTCEQTNGRWIALFEGPPDASRAQAVRGGFRVLELLPATLDDIFVARAGRRISSMGD